MNLPAVLPAVVPRRFGEHDRIGIGIGTAEAVWYRWVKSEPAGYLFERARQPGIFESFTHEEFAELERDQGYRYIADGYSEEKAAARLLSGIDHFAFLPEDEAPKVLWREEWCKRVVEKRKAMKGRRVRMKMSDLIAEIDADMVAEARLAASAARAGWQTIHRKAPGARRLRDWLKTYEKAGRRAEALRDQYRECGKNTPAISGAVESLIVVCARAYLTEKVATQVACYKLLKDNLHDLNAERAERGRNPLPLPCDRVLYDRIRRLGALEKTLGRAGQTEAAKEFAASTTGFDVRMPGERIEIDEWMLPLQTLLIEAGEWEKLTEEQREAVERVRWWVSVAIDVATRCILAMRLSRTANTAYTGVSTLAMIVADKSRYANAVGALTPWDMCTGLGLVATDMGAAYVSNEFRWAIAACGGELLTPPAGLAHQRPHIERFFGGTGTRLMCLFTGRTFANVVAKGDYKSEKRASLVTDDAAWALVRHVVDDYHNTGHPGLGGETPRNAWLRLVKRYNTKPLPAPVTNRIVFGIKTRARLGRRGVRCMNLFYNSPVLQRHRQGVGDVVLDVRVDPNDIGWISVRVAGESTEDGGWLSVPCSVRGFDGVHAMDWKLTCDDLRRRFGAEQAISEPVVRKALKAIRERAESAERRAGIVVELTTEEIEDTRASLNFAWSTPLEPECDNDRDLLGTLIYPANGVAPTALPPPIPAKTGRKQRSVQERPKATPTETKSTDDDWTMED